VIDLMKHITLKLFSIPVIMLFEVNLHDVKYLNVSSSSCCSAQFSALGYLTTVGTVSVFRPPRCFRISQNGSP
jgi:hypothetical protein